VLLEPAGFSYYENDSAIHILPQEELDALPLIEIKHRCIFITPSEFIEFFCRGFPVGLQSVANAFLFRLAIETYSHRRLSPCD